MSSAIVVDVPAEIANRAKSSFSAMEKGIKKLGSAAEQGRKSLDGLGKSAKNMAREAEMGINRVTESVKPAKRGIGDMEEQVSKYDRTAKSADRQTKNLQRTLMELAKERVQILLTARDRLTPILQEARSELQALSGKTCQVTLKAADHATAPIRGLIDLLGASSLEEAGEALGLNSIVPDSIKAYENFEAAVINLKTASGASGRELELLTEKAKELGTSTKFTATEAAEGFRYMAASGWKSRDMLNGISGVMDLASASGMELAKASGIVAAAMDAFGLQAGNSGHVADVLSQAAEKAQTGLSALGEAFRSAAPSAGAMKYSVEDTSLALGLMAAASVTGSEAGAALNTALANLASPTRQIRDAMRQYGVSLTDSHGEMKTLKGVMDNLRGSLGGLSEEEKKAAVFTLFGEDAMSGMLAVIGASEEDYEGLASALAHTDGAAKRMSDTMTDHMLGSLEFLEKRVEAVKQAFGERLSPYIRQFADWMLEWAPIVEAGMNEFMDYVDEKAGQIRDIIADFTATSEWKNADFFGKVQISWDRLIAQPFTGWWNSTGKSLAANVLQSIGKGIGAGVSLTLSALFGLDVSHMEKEGMDLAGAFGSGLKEGLAGTDLKGAFAGAVKGLLGSAGKLLPGGEEAGLSSVLSAMVIGKAGATAVKGAKKLRGLFAAGGAAGTAGAGAAGAAAGTAAGAGILSGVIGSAAAGTGILGWGSRAAIGMGAGNMAGGASLSAGALSTIGLGSAAMGTVGAGVAIDGIVNIYKGLLSSSQEEAKAYKEAGWMKAGGSGGGALAGMIVGSILGPLGTAAGAAIGAGIGGIIGKIKGDEHIKSYEEEIQKAEQKAAEAALKESKAFLTTGKAVDKVKFSTRELNEAFEDSKVSAEEFEKMYQRAVEDSLKSHFGDIELSMGEIKELASGIILGDNAQAFTQYQEAVDGTRQRILEMQDALSNLQRMNWKASMGIEIASEDKEAHLAEVDEYVESAKQYVQDKLYERHTKRVALMGEEKASKYDEADKEEYAYKMKTIDEQGIVIKDQVLNKDWAGEKESQNLIAEVSGMKEDSDPMVKMEAWEKEGQVGMDYDSFKRYVAEAARQKREAKRYYDEMYKTLMKESTSEEERQDATAGHARIMKEMDERPVNQLFDTLATSYDKELSNIFPEDVDIAKTLRDRTYDAIAKGEDVGAWKAEDVAKWLGLEGLDDKIQGQIAEFVRQIAVMMPQEEPGGLSEIFSLSSFLKTQLSEDLTGIDPLPFVTPLITGLFDAFNHIDLSETDTGLGAKIKQAIEGLGRMLPEDMTRGMKENLSVISGKCNEMRSATETSLKTAFTPAFDVIAKLNLRWSGITLPSLHTEKKPQPHTNPLADHPAYARGGIVNSRQLSWVGEEGPEAIIPLVPSRRRRAMDLYERAGRLLGVGRHSEGGIINLGAGYGQENRLTGESLLQLYPKTQNPELTEASFPGGSGISVDTGVASGDVKVSVQVQLSPQFDVSATDRSEQDIKLIIKRSMKELSNDLAAELAKGVEEAFQNMPRARAGSA